MPQDVVMVLGFAAPDYKHLPQELTIRGENNTEDDPTEFVPSEYLEQLNSHILESMDETLKDFGVDPRPISWGKHRFEFTHLQEEEWDERFEDSVRGICLTGRYFPTFLDFECPNGMGAMHLTPERMALIDRLRERMAEKYPFFKHSYVCIQQVWY